MVQIIFHESKDYYDSVEGTMPSELFGMDIPVTAKRCGEIYGMKCTDHFRTLSLKQLSDEDSMMSILLRATAAYLIDLIEENDDCFDLGEGFVLDEDTPLDVILHMLRPIEMLAENSSGLTEQEAPPSFSLKLAFKPVADECVEWVVRDDEVVYVGCYEGVNAWNEKISKKAWNYINQI